MVLTKICLNLWCNLFAMVPILSQFKDKKDCAMDSGNVPVSDLSPISSVKSSVHQKVLINYENFLYAVDQPI